MIDLLESQGREVESVSELHHLRTMALPAALAAAAAAFVLVSLVAEGETPAPIELRSPPSLEQMQRDTAHLPGEKVFVIDPPPSEPATATTSGPYRFLGPGFTGSLGVHQAFPVPAQGHRSADPAFLSASPLYLPLEQELPGWTLVGVHTGDGDSNTVLQQVFRNGSGDTIRITRIYRAYLPIDVLEPRTGPGATMRLERMTVDGLPAYALVRTPASPVPRPWTYLSFVDGPIETVIDAEGFNLEQALDLAKRIRGQETAATRAGSQPPGARS
ncbi:MAG: hypothetical protein KatS3mg063_2627 [Tepidiforma sp.]|nr:MAG: hypothetical protein KatS3mg063_2627 [Tepidiforma sp.]